MVKVRKKGRFRSKKYLQYVASKPCILCQNTQTQAHHLTIQLPNGLRRGMGQKQPDNWTVPLCFNHHHLLHTCGKNERDFWDDLDINIYDICKTFYEEYLADNKIFSEILDLVYEKVLHKSKKHIDFLWKLK